MTTTLTLAQLNRVGTALVAQRNALDALGVVFGAEYYGGEPPSLDDLASDLSLAETLDRETVLDLIGQVAKLQAALTARLAPATREDEWLSIAQACAILNLKAAFVKELCRRGDLKGAQKFGDLWRVPRRSLTAYQSPDRKRKPRAPREKPHKQGIKSSLA